MAGSDFSTYWYIRTHGPFIPQALAPCTWPIMAKANGHGHASWPIRSHSATQLLTHRSRVPRHKSEGSLLLLRSLKRVSRKRP